MYSKDLPFDIFRENGEKFLAEYDEALEWMKGLGLPAIESRLGKYKIIVENFGENLDLTKDDVASEQLFHEFLNAQMEIAETIRIFHSLSNRDFDEFSQQLKKVTSGQPFRNASKSDPSRDFLFELTMASRFIVGGFEVQLNQIADIVAVKDGFPKLFLECKRIKSEKRIQDNVKKANEQLKKRIAADKSKQCRGLAALNVNDLINPENDMIIVEDVNDLQRLSSNSLANFVTKNERNLESKKTNKHLGILVEATMQGYIIESGVHSTINCRGAKLYQYNNSNADSLTLSKVGELISNQNITR
ncbi:TPA: hypothetical protein ACN310_004601 [Vibrio parahaemolyticus]|uniref:hypothetical protein n=1 Tax=Vibrio parahaemolyticus TaxID=670 RepID=UPI0011158FE9|nr:hypothetical protein [Vibrio parahaemolyticus]EHW0655868.1 hypothetical protein [Vibrio parahaemolyticus]EJE4701752.1 hypothetical protein [Vibrio parahaemolyticus]TXM28884.1 hypothetical protein FVP00_25375 [Vibrio parahaemolyticus]